MKKALAGEAQVEFQKKQGFKETEAGSFQKVYWMETKLSRTRREIRPERLRGLNLIPRVESVL